MVNGADVTVNGRRYRYPIRPVVVVCIDGGEPLYVEHGIADGATPALARFRQRGLYRLARSVVPSFTNPNNLSIVTGVPPSVHGICGNYFFDPGSGQEVMMNDPEFLRCDTLLAALSRAGARPVVITAKDKLRRLLGHGMRGICFSSEKAAEVTKDEHGIERVTELVDMPVPSVYSAELSEYVLAAGLALLERERPDVMYLSLTDYVQHKHAPGAPAATRFYAMLDRYFDAFDRAGAVLGITADHGMNGKAKADGSPNVVYLGPLLDGLLGPGQARVILPITDPYVVHHGALGSFATVHLARPADAARVLARLSATEGIAEVHDRAAGCARFELPPDRTGDVIVVAERHAVLGKSPEAHDLSLLEEPLRSHGGASEQTVPFILNRPLTAAYAGAEGDLRNFDIFEYALNGVD
ncbi:MAG: phosphonoacetate hydrolase [Candidatus Rokuibacteriota bacterium]